MAKRKVKEMGKNTDVNAEGNEKDDNSSVTVGNIATYSTQDDNAKIAGLAKGYNSRQN